MPRRRMIDPDFWNDSRIKKLPPVERLLFLGMVSHADDDGRLLADPAYLRSKIFPYDNFTLEDMLAMRNSILKANPNLQFYQNGGEEYLYFRKWPRYQKPSHPQESKIPLPPKFQEPVTEQVTEQLTEQLTEQFTEQLTEQDQQQARTIPSQVRSGQSSQGKGSIGQVRVVQEDFTEFLSSEKDLTDFLTRTLTKYIPRGPTAAVDVLYKLWEQALGQAMPQAVFELTFAAVRKYPVPVLARSYAKLVKYKGGKTGSWKYLDKILKEQAEKEKP